MNRRANAQADPIVQVRRSGVGFAGSPSAVQRARRQFGRRHAIRLPGLLEPGLLRAVQRAVDQGQFCERVHEASGAESCMRHNATSALLRLLTNDQRLFRAVQAITGCGPIGCFIGRVYRMVPGRGHHHRWHDDAARFRLIGMSVNLSAEVYCGGALEIRDNRSRRVLSEFANTGFGDAVLFRIASHLEHRVTGVKGAVAKTAFAGWFCSRPDLRASLVRRRPGAPSRRHSGRTAPESLDGRVKIPGTVVFPQIGEEIVLLNRETGRCYGLGPAGSRFWRLLVRRGSVRAAVERMAAGYGEAAGTLERDFLRLLHSLEANGLVEILR